MLQVLVVYGSQSGYKYSPNRILACGIARPRSLVEPFVKTRQFVVPSTLHTQPENRDMAEIELHCGLISPRTPDVDLGALRRL
jgi:hypothetical protein